MLHIYECRICTQDPDYNSLTLFCLLPAVCRLVAPDCEHRRVSSGTSLESGQWVWCGLNKLCIFT